MDLLIGGLAVAFLVGSIVLFRMAKTSPVKTTTLDSSPKASAESEKEESRREFERMKAEMSARDVPVRSTAPAAAPPRSYGPVYVVIFVLIVGGVWFLYSHHRSGEHAVGSKAPGSQKLAVAHLLDEYEDKVNFYKKKLIEVSDSAEFQRIVSEELTPEVESFVKRFNEMSHDMSAGDYRRIHSRMSRINQKYRDMCQQRRI